MKETIKEGISVFVSCALVGAIGYFALLLGDVVFNLAK